MDLTEWAPSQDGTSADVAKGKPREGRGSAPAFKDASVQVLPQMHDRADAHRASHRDTELMQRGSSTVNPEGAAAGARAVPRAPAASHATSAAVQEDGYGLAVNRVEPSNHPPQQSDRPLADDDPARISSSSRSSRNARGHQSADQRRIDPPPVLQRPSLSLEDSESERNVCVICLLPAMRTLRLECGHSFCSACIVRWADTKASCPTCRRALSAKELAALVPSSSTPELATPRDIAVLSVTGQAVGTPHTLYVWCSCWRRLVIPSEGNTTCVCGKLIDPTEVRAKNKQVWDGEYPVTCRQSCAGCSDFACSSTLKTRASWCGVCAALSMLVLCGVPALSFGIWKLTNVCCSCLAADVCTKANQIILMSSFVAPLPIPIALAAVSGAECCCYSDRTGRLRPESPVSWDPASKCLGCCHPSREKCCIADDDLALCLLCTREEEPVNLIWLV